MPFQKNGKRDYKKELEWQHGKPDYVKKRVERNKARRWLEADGVVSKGDGKDVDHVKALSKGGKTTKSNLKAVPASKNRSFSRNADGSMKSQKSLKEKKK
jgi:hypothetical protein